MRSSRSRHAFVSCALALLGLTACEEAPVASDGGDPIVDGGPPPTCDSPPTIELGDPDGHAEPLGSGPGEARAGRIAGSAIPQHPSGLGVWGEGGFVLANDRVAMVIEDVGPSHLYDPWGGRPLAIGQVEGGAFVRPGDFGEVLILAGRFTVLTTSVTVMNEGSDGEAAIVRAAGPMRALPFFDEITRPILITDFSSYQAAIDYVLEPGSNHVDVWLELASPEPRGMSVRPQLHGFMFTERLPPFAVGPGFEAIAVPDLEALLFTDERGTGYAYADPDGPTAPGVNASGFVSRLGGNYLLPACTATRVHHARITLAGPGADALVVALADEAGETLREISGVVRDASGDPAVGVRVHAVGEGERYLSRSLPTGADGRYSLHVDPDENVRVFAYRQGDALVGPIGAGEDAIDLALGVGGSVHVVALGEDGESIPARIQVLPRGSSVVPSTPGSFGEEQTPGRRVAVSLSETGEATLRVPAGEWEVVVSHGYEYEIARQPITIDADGETIEVEATLERVIDTTDVQCADFHIHTRRSNDSPDDPTFKVRGALADGVEIPVRSDHEYVEDFQPIVAALGMQEWAFGVASIEMTSMEKYGHFGVVPLDPDADAVNGGAPLWQDYPTNEDPDSALRLLTPVELFEQVRARPEQPTVIINHPSGGKNYFGYTEFDRATGTGRAGDWDEEFTAVEFFNDADWRRNRDGLVEDWFALLRAGRRMFAVGSSDSHSLSGSPVGYPRTCMQLGTDDPRELTPNAIRDAVANGRGTISGGVYVDTSIGAVGPGGEATGVGSTVQVHVRVQAASWVDVDAVEIVVDGETIDTIEILPEDGDGGVVRFEREVTIDVAAGAGSYVIVAAYGDASLEPVHPGRIPFGVTNPIFVTR